MAPYCLLITFLLALSSLPLSFADILQIQINTTTPAHLFIDRFGFHKTYGRLELNISDIYVSNTSPPINLSMIGFALIKYKTIPIFINGREFPRHDDIHPFSYADRTLIVSTFQDFQGNDSFNLVYSDFDYGDNYNFRFRSYYHVNISMNIRYAMYNLVDDGNGNHTIRSYISGSKARHSYIYTIFLLLYLVFWILLFLISYYKKKGNTNSSLGLFPIHKVMLLVLLLKTLSVIFDLSAVSYIIHTGCFQCCFFSFLTFMSIFLKRLPLVILLQLIASGWSFLRPSMLCKDKVLLIFSGSFELVMTVVTVTLECNKTTQSDNFPTYVLLMVMPSLNEIHIVAVLISVKWSNKFLDQARQAHEKVSNCSTRHISLELYFFVILIHYLLKCFFHPLMSSYEDLWVSVMVDEIWTIILFAFIGCKFSPQKLSFISKYIENSEKAAAMLYSHDLEKIKNC